MNMEKKSIAGTLKAARAACGYSVEKVSKLLMENENITVRPKTIYGYESGYSVPSVNVFLALCNIYGMSDILNEFGYSNQPGRTIPAQRTITLDKHEVEVISSYRKQPTAIQDAVDRVLNVPTREEELQRAKKNSAG